MDDRVCCYSRLLLAGRCPYIQGALTSILRSAECLKETHTRSGRVPSVGISFQCRVHLRWYTLAEAHVRRASLGRLLSTSFAAACGRFTAAAAEQCDETTEKTAVPTPRSPPPAAALPVPFYAFPLPVHINHASCWLTWECRKTPETGSKRGFHGSGGDTNKKRRGRRLQVIYASQFSVFPHTQLTCCGLGLQRPCLLLRVAWPTFCATRQSRGLGCLMERSAQDTSASCRLQLESEAAPPPLRQPRRGLRRR